MADFNAFRDLTEAERKNWLNVQRENRSGATRAEYEGKDKARTLIGDLERKDRDRAVEDGNENDGGRSR